MLKINKYKGMKLQTPIKYAFFIVLAISLSSCVTSKYEKPQITDDALYRESSVKDSTTIADIPWQTYFTDSNLRDLINEGLSNSFDLQIADSRIRQAESTYGISKYAYYPTLSANASYTSSKLNYVQGMGLRNHTDVFQLGASASWEIDIWNKIGSSRKASLAAFLQSQAYKKVVQTGLVASIANNYYSLLALDKQLNITQTTIGLLKQNVETMQALKEADIVTGAAVEQSKALLYNTEISIPDLENNIRVLENTICLLIGRNPGNISRSNIENQTVPTELNYGVPAQLLSKRPDVIQAELAYRQAFEQTNVAKASLYPSLTLTGSAGYSTLKNIDNFFDYSNLLASVVGGIAQPIFNQGKLKNQVKVQQEQQQQALLSFKQAVLNAGNEVSNALFAYNSSKKKDQHRVLQIKALQNSVDYTKELLVYSNADYTEVLTAEQSLLSAQLNQVNDKLQQLQAAVSLYRALGGGAN